MGEMLLNGRLYGANGVMELTQAQYDALPQSKLTDGVLYCIKDTGFVEGEQFAPVIYSLEEREIGTWIDGKPLYQKTIHINALPSTTFVEVDYPHNIANIDTICDYFGVVRWSNGGVAPIGARIYFQNLQTGDKLSADPCIQFQCTKTNITICVGQDRSSMTADINICYTKTTDIAGSGTYGTDGARMVHYSNTEHVIGTWLDGKTLYEKTIDCGALPNATTKTIAHNVNFDFIVNAFGTAQDTTTKQVFPIPFTNSAQRGSTYDTTDSQIMLFITTTDITLRSWVNRSNFNKTYVTMQYTKTT